MIEQIILIIVTIWWIATTIVDYFYCKMVFKKVREDEKLLNKTIERLNEIEFNLKYPDGYCENEFLDFCFKLTFKRYFDSKEIILAAANPKSEKCFMVKEHSIKKVGDSTIVFKVEVLFVDGSKRYFIVNTRVNTSSEIDADGRYI